MSSVIAAASNLLGTVLALIVAVLGYFADVGLTTLLLRSLVAGVAVGFLVRALGAITVRILLARFEAPPASPREPGHAPEPPAG